MVGAITLAIAASTALIPTKVHAATALQATEANITDKSATASAEIVTTDGNSITDGTTIRSKVTFTRANDFVTYRVRIDNVTDKAYTVEAITDDNTSTNVIYEYGQHAGATLPAASAFYFDVTARYVATPSLDDRYQSINVRFHFTLKDVETGEEVEEELLIVPDTGAKAEEIANAKHQNFILYFDIAVFIIIVVALIVKFTKNKKAKLIIPIVALVGTVTGFIVSAAEFPFELIITSEYSYKDRLAVTYEVDGEEQVVAVNNGDTLENKIEDPSKTGYTFTGWLDENNEPVDLTQPIEDDTKIHAAFTPISYILHIDIDDDYNFALTVPLKYDEEYTLPEVDHSLWYIDEYHYGWFDDGPDWNTEEDDHYYTVGQVVKNLATVDGAEIWLETEWRPRILAATYLDFYDDELVAQLPTEVSYVYFDDHGGEIPLPHPLEREGYRLKWFEINGHPQYQGLYPDYLEDEDTYTVKAIWEKKVLNICYRVYGRVDEFEGQTECDSVEYGEEYEVRENYFIHYGHDAIEGWSTTPEGTTIAYSFGATLNPNSYINDCGNINYCELSLYAIWTPRTTTLHFTPGDGVTDATGTVPDVTFTYGQPAALNANNVFKRPGFTLSSWNCGDAGTYAPYFTADGWTYYATYEATCKANWDANRYHIQFEPNADDTTGQMTGITVFYGDDTNLTPNSFKRTGYTFAGWKKDNAGDLIADRSSAGQFAVSSGAVVKLYAQWTPIHYSIVFDKNDDAAQGSMENQSITYDEPTVLRENTFTREHYKFMGWNTQAGGTGTSYADKAEVTNLASEEGATITLYAQWKERTAMLQTGPNVKSALSNLNNTATTFKRYDGANAPDLDSINDKVDIALPTSSFPVWAWSEGDNIYWWSEAEAPKFNPTSNNFFNGLSFTSIDVSGLDASSATNMNGMFANLRLTSLNLSGFDSSAAKNMGSMFSGTTISSLDLSSLNTSSATTMGSMFYRAKIDSLKLYDETNPSESLFKTDSVTEMAGMFRESNIPSIDASKFNTAKVKNFSGMFMSTSATTIDVSGWNTESATDFTNTFANVKITSLDLSHFNTKKVTSMLGMFDGTVNMENLNVSGWDNESLTTVGYMFRSCGKNVANGATINLAGFTTSKVKSMNLMFSGSGFISLNLGSFSSAELTDMSKMFSEMGKIQSLSFGPDFTAEHVTNMSSAFAQMGRSMVNLDLSSLNVSSVTNLNSAFASNNAVTIDLTGWDFSNVESANSTFYGANYIATIYASSDFPTSLGGTSFAYGQPIKGGAGTTYIGNENAYARIDDPDNGNPGYFTPKNAHYIRYDANEPYGETATGQTQSHYASSVAPYTQVQTNGFAIDSYRFLGWGTSPDSVVVYEPGALIDDIDAGKEPYTLYAKWEQVVPPTLMQSMLNDKLKEIVAAAGATDDDVVAVKEATNPPAEQLIDDNVISSPESSYKIWAYYTDGTIWIYTEDGLTPHAPDMLGNMLSGFPNLTDVSWLSKLDVSNTTDISSLFDQDTSLADISPLANWDTSKLTSILGTFRGTAISDLSPIATKSCGDKTCWDTSNLEEISSAFQRMTNLSDLSPLATWNVSKLNDLNFAFYDTSSLTDFSGISGWRLKATGEITMLMTFDNRDADYSVLENWFSERTNGTEGLTMTSAFPNIDSTKLPSWAQ
ncbi:BspA family leucine-rich repeat surface protein [Candidatus Saccharibacteria bacterium]|nr:BspA family leucine-rich repeat surface protein [Candidatus Saccharibacteria bacterium]